MSLANDLLQTLSVEEDDKTLVIDHYTRSIIIPKGITTLGVETDDGVLILEFRMPRYLNTVDLSKFKIRVNYINAQGEDDFYKVTDSRVVGNNVLFSWRVGPTATAYKGETRFSVEMVNTDAQSTVLNEYNTAIAKLPVLEGLEVDAAVITRYTDILEQWESRLFGISGTEEAKLITVSEEQQSYIVNKGNEVLATIPADYTTTSRVADKAERTKADAIICSAEGETVKMEDSSDDYLRGLYLYGKTNQVVTTGKNLLSPFTKGITISTTNGSIYESSRSAVTDYIPVDFKTNPKYCLSGMLNTLYSFVAAYNANHEFLGRTGAGSYNELTFNSSHFSGGTAVGTGDIAFVRVSTYENTPAVNGSISDIDNMKAQLEAGNAATEYEPYSGGFASPSPDWPQPLESFDNVNVAVAGKNLLNITTGGSLIGVTETVSDGLVSFSGTAAGSGGRTAWARGPHVVLYPGVYTLTTKAPSGTAPQACLTKSDTSAIVANGNSTFSLNETTSVYLGFNYINGTTYNAKNVSVQLEVGDTATEYEPYRVIQTLTYNLPDKFYAGTLDCLTGDLKYAGISTPQTTQWAAGRNSSGWNQGYDTIGAQTIPFHWHLGNAKDDYFPDTLCTHFPAAKSWPGITAASKECAYRGNASGLSFVAIRINRSRLVPYGFVDDGTQENAVYAFEAWLDAQAQAGTPVQFVDAINQVATVESFDPNSYFPTTTVLNDSGASMKVTYNADTKTWIENLIDAKIVEYLQSN